MDPYKIVFYAFPALVTILHLGRGAQDTPVDRLEAIQNTSVPLVYMAVPSVTVSEFDADSTLITVIRSEAVSYDTFVDLGFSYNDRRNAFLYDKMVTIPANGTNATALVRVSDASSMFFAQDSIYNISITDADNCDVGSPSSTILIVKPETTVTLSFNFAYDSGEECYCEDCCYNSIMIISSKQLVDDMTIRFLTGSNDTAKYNEDYSFDREYADPQRTVNLSSYRSNHYLDVYIRKDGRLENTEFFRLRFDESTLPERVLVGSPNEMMFDIYDSDFGYINISDSSQYVSEDVGTIDLIVDTNIIQQNESLILNVTMEPTYSPDSESATPGEDYVPFEGIYILPPGDSRIVVPITIINDDLAELEEIFAFQVETLYMNKSYNAFAIIYIEDDETSKTPLLFSFDTKSVAVNESSGTLEFYVRANIKNEAFIYLQYIPSEGNGLMEYQDYTVHFHPTIKREFFQFNKNMEYKIEMNILNDCDVEITEMVTLNISDVSFGQVDPENYSLTITVEDNDREDELNCPACSCGGGMWPTEQPTTEPEPGPVMFNFELDEFKIYEGECSFYDIDVVATRPTNATVFIGIQPWELQYGVDFTISAKKLVFENNDRQNFSFRALQDTMDEDAESTLINIAYASNGMIGRRNAILVHVLNERGTTSDGSGRSTRSIDERSLRETPSQEFQSTVITTGLVAGIVSSLLVVMVTTILFVLAVVLRKPKQPS